MSLRRIRKNFREEVLRLIAAGEASPESLYRLAFEFYGRNSVGYMLVLQQFAHHELHLATSHLRNEGTIETVGQRNWKMAESLNQDDFTVIQNRRKARINGELKAGERMAHECGNHDLALVFATAIRALSAAEAEPAPQEV